MLLSKLTCDTNYRNISKIKIHQMISCNELRLGNRVLVNGNLHKVSQINGTTIFTIDADESNGLAATEHKPEQLQPVPMTNEILKQCGFVFHDYFKFWQLKTTGNMSEIDIDRDFGVIDFMRRPILRNLLSLHQLQNVYFMLKGREMTLFTQNVVKV